MYLTIGAGQFDGGVAASIITTDTPGPVGVLIEDGQWCNKDSDYTYRALDLPKASDGYSQPYFSTLFHVSATNSSLGLGADKAFTETGYFSNCANKSVGMTFTMDAGDYNSVTGKYTAIFWVNGNPNPAMPMPAAAENSFRIGVNNGAGDAKATFMTKSAAFGTSLFNMSNRNHPANTTDNYVVDFTPPCSVTSDREVGIQFYDADNGIYQKNPPNYPWALTYNFEKGPRGSITGPAPVYVKFGGNIPVPSSGEIDGGDKQYSTHLYSTINGDSSYRLTIDGLSYVNAISYTIEIPLDVLTASDSCAPPGSCIITAIANLSTGGEVYPGNPIRFNVNTNGVPSGRQLGVNGAAYGGTPAAGGFNNYLVSGNQLARGSPVGVGPVTAVGKEGTLPSTGVTTIDDMMFGTSGDGNLTQIIAPSTPGTYAFSWGLVNPNVDWQPITECTGTLEVKPIPTITISGSLYDAEDMGIRYGGIAIETCTGQYPVTDANGNYSFNILMGTAFCIRANSWPAYSESAGVRPSLEGYWNCPGYGGGYSSPNYCTATSTYECQTAGLHAPSGCGIAGLDRNSDSGYDIAFVIKKIVVQGTMVNAYNLGQKYSGISVSTCVAGVSATSDVNGYYAFVVRQGTGFCIRANNLPAGSVAVNIRPWSEGYASGGCPGYSAATATPNYCAPYGTYEYQQAGVKSTLPSFDFYDRNSDTGYDFAFRFPPKQKCTVGAAPTSEIGTDYVPTITVTNTGDSNRPPIETGNIYLTINGTTSNGDYTPAGAKLTYGNSISTPGGFAMVPASIPLPNASTYTITAGFSPVSPGAGDGIAAINDNVGGGACEGSTSTIRAAEPYVRAYGSDIVAGGGFASSGGACSTYSAGVYGFASGSGISYKGSASQYGITTHSNILGFFSAGNRSVANTPPRGLTFSNTTAVDVFGSNFGGTPPCISDYFSDPNASPAPLNGGTRDSSVKELPWAGVIIPVPEKRRYVAAPGNVTFGALNVKAGSQAAIYIDGNLALTGDITFDSAASVANLPNLAVIVRGNIYITPNVKRLDGLYVAQPKNLASPTDGRIYTCAKATFQLYNSAELTSQCGVPAAQQLAINGALIAQQVKFLRTMFSVKDSTANSTSPSDIPNFLDGSPSGNSANTKAAEVINYTPEIYLAPSALKDPNQACLIASCKYDSIYSLPPVF